MSLGAALLLAACDGDEAAPTAPHKVPMGWPPDAAGARDAQVAPDAAAVDAGRPDAAWRPPIVRPLPDSVCALAVGAECDGAEDCAQGERCCGRFEPTLFAYTSIACRAECDDEDDFELCHPGDRCANGEAVCRASLIIPHDFIGVCAAEATVPPVTGSAVAGEVRCGATNCTAGSEKCCLGARYDFRVLQLSALEPYCAALDHDCSCDHAVAPPDAGPPSQDAGPPLDDDAGAI